MASLIPGTDPNLVPAGMAPDGSVEPIGGGPSLAAPTIVLETLLMSIAILVVSVRIATNWSVRSGESRSLNASDCKLFPLAMIVKPG